MSKREGPGRYMPAAGTECGFDGGNDNAPVCGAPATWHVFAGSPDVGPGDYMMTACDTHANTAFGLAFDWHPFGGVCDIPGTRWQSRNKQGDGFCYWPAAAEAVAEEIAHDNAHV